MSSPLPSAGPAVLVRPATLADLDEVAPLFDAYRQFYGQTAELERSRRYLYDRIRNAESVVLLAKATAESDQALGFCQLYPTFCSVEMTSIYVLYDLFVIAGSRRMGVGRSMLQGAERLASANGKARLELRTGRTNLPAQAAYESLHWVRDERFFTYVKVVAPNAALRKHSG